MRSRSVDFEFNADGTAGIIYVGDFRAVGTFRAENAAVVAVQWKGVNMTGHELVAELAGLRCRCGAVKIPRQTFCRRCYRLLPRSLAKALYKRMGAGYEDAYAAACAHLEDEGVKRAL